LQLFNYKTGQFFSVAKITVTGGKADARGVSSSGSPLNVNPDIQFVEGIIGCRLKDYPVINPADIFNNASLHGSTQPHRSTLSHSLPTIKQVMNTIVVASKRVFGCNMIKLHKEV
jgi:lipoate-protein ligase B